MVADGAVNWANNSTWWDYTSKFTDTADLASSNQRKSFSDGTVASGTDGVHLGTNTLLYADGHVKSIRMVKDGMQNLTGYETWVSYFPPGDNRVWDETCFPKG